MYYPKFTQFKVPVALLCAAIVAACAPSVNVRTDAAPDVDMGKYQTYNFFTTLGIEQEGAASLLGQHFRSAIGAQMDSRGYSPSDSPQLQVNVTASTDDKIWVNTYQDPYLYGGYYGRRGFYDPYWGSPMYFGGGTTRTTVSQYTQANIYIDLIDASQHRMVWQGAASFTLTEKMQKNVADSVNRTVSEIFSKYPVPAKQAN